MENDFMADILEQNEKGLRTDSNESDQESSSSSGDDDLRIKSHLEETKHFYIGNI